MAAPACVSRRMKMWITWPDSGSLADNTGTVHPLKMTLSVICVSSKQRAPIRQPPRLYYCINWPLKLNC